MSQTHVVLGASGGAGTAIVGALAQLGHDTRAITRRGDAAVPVGVERVAADISDAGGAATAVRGAEVVYLAAQPGYTRWAQEFPAMLDTVIAATATVGAKLVMVDNLYAYGAVEAPMAEDTPQVATDTKGRVRAMMAQRLLAAHAAGDLRVAIGRASDFFGPRVTSSALSELIFDPLKRPKGALRWIGRLDQPHSVAYIPDIARALVVLGTDTRADGRTWHLPHAPAVTGRQFLDMVNAALTAPRPVRRISPPMVRLAALVNPMVRETAGILHQWDRPFVVDDQAFRDTFSVPSTPLAEAIRETVASLSAPASVPS